MKGFSLIPVAFLLAIFSLFFLPGAGAQTAESVEGMGFLQVERKYEALQAQLLYCSPAERYSILRERDIFKSLLEKFRYLNNASLGSIKTALDVERAYLNFLSDKKLDGLIDNFQTIIDLKKVEASDLAQFYTASTYLLFALHDSQKALTTAQIGISKADDLIGAGKLDVGAPGDCQTIFERCRLLKAKAQAYAMMDRVDEAKAAADEMMASLSASLTHPVFSGGWKFPTNYGFITLFPLTIQCVVQAAFRAGAEDAVKELLPWVEQALASQTALLETVGAKLSNMGQMMENYKRIGVQARGEALLLAGKAADALKVFESCKIDPSLDLKVHAYMMFFLMPKAKAMAEVGRKTEALKILSDLRTAAKGFSAGNFLYVYKWLPPYVHGEMLEKTGDPVQAVEAYKESIASIRGIYGNISLASTRREIQKETDKIYSRLVSLLLDQGKTEEALQFLEESYGKSLVDLFEDVLKDPRREWPKEFKDKAEKLKQELWKLEQDDSGPATGPNGEMKQTRDLSPKAVETRRSLRLELRSKYEQVVREAARVTVEKRKAGEAVGLLACSRESMAGKTHRFQELVKTPVVTSVIFLVSEDPCYALILGNGKSQVIRLPQKAAKIRSLSARFRNAVVSNKKDWKKSGSELYAAIFQPLESGLAGLTRVLIIPDGMLWYVPFAALVDGSGKAFCEKFSFGIVSGIPLAANLLESGRKADRPKTPSLLVLADPDGSLPSAKVEGETVSKLASGAGSWKSNSLSNREATETAFRKKACSPDVYALHFATHGILDESNPFSSFLLLSPTTEDDGHLEIFEIANELNLSNISLAVLSACNTAMGTVSGGNEVICMQQAFHESGVPHVLASLWEVSDEATSRLMSCFYTNVFGEKSTGDSLSQAIKELIAESPSKWAAFQVYGLP